MKGRFQLPDQAKFNRPDPMRDWNWLQPHTINLFEYVGNDPIDKWDPTGFSKKTVEKILKAIDNKLNVAYEKSGDENGWEMEFGIYQKRNGKIKGTRVKASPERTGGTSSIDTPAKAQFKGMGHTHHQDLDGSRNNPPSTTDVVAGAVMDKENVHITQTDDVRYVVESNDPGKAKEFLATLGGTEEDMASKIWDLANSYAQEFQNENPNATRREVHEYAITKLASQLGASVYKTSMGEDQTIVQQITIKKDAPKEIEGD